MTSRTGHLAALTPLDCKEVDKQSPQGGPRWRIRPQAACWWGCSSARAGARATSGWLPSLNPMHPEVKSAIMAADVLMGNDRDCFAWIKANRDPNASAGAREGREGRRRSRG